MAVSPISQLSYADFPVSTTLQKIAHKQNFHRNFCNLLNCFVATVTGGTVLSTIFIFDITG